MDSTSHVEHHKLIAPARRKRHEARLSRKPLAKRGAFRLWQAATLSDQHLNDLGMTRWIVIGDAQDAEAAARNATASCALWFRYIRFLQNLARPSLTEDRNAFLDNAAAKTQDAAQRNDFRTSYAMARA